MIRIAMISAALLFTATSAPAHAKSSPAAMKSAFCKKLYAEMSARPARKAMALSTDGRICNAVWGEASQKSANRKAISGCEEGRERKCRLIGL